LLKAQTRQLAEQGLQHRRNQFSSGRGDLAAGRRDGRSGRGRRFHRHALESGGGGLDHRQRPGGFDPVAFSLEWICGQPDAAPALVRMERFPINRCSRQPKLPQRVQHHGHIALL